MKFDSAVKAVLALAALVAAFTFAWSTFTSGADPVHAAGVDTREGFAIEGVGFNRQGGFLVLSGWAENPFEAGDMRHTLTVYELIKDGQDGKAKLHLVGSRALDHDQGPDLIKFEEIKGETPRDLKEAIEKGAPKARRR